MKKRNPWFVGIMSLITLGLYQLYWFIVTRNEMVRKGAKIPSIFIILTPLLGLILVVILLILAQVTHGESEAGNTVVMVVNVLSVLLGIVSILAMIPAFIYWVYKYCNGVLLVTKGQTTFDFSFWLGLLFWILGLQFVWAGIIQNRFNTQVR